MSKPVCYKQCKLQHENNVQVCFIPESSANTTLKVRVKGDERWWNIIEVYDSSRIEEHLIRDVAHNSDIIWKATSGSTPRGNK